MENNAVLVIGNEIVGDLLQFLAQRGLKLIQGRKMQGILKQVEQKNIVAIVLQEDTTDFDVLELVLNVRDVDDQVPIVILSSEGEVYYKPFRTLGCLCMAYDPNGSHSLDELSKLLDRPRKLNG